ncbi:XerC Integrase [uncultured Caudovirales phage]|uniref:Integrase n=1 Tax=uncultured Caudovirales phage TaxID=2100421 RepID=A0A6J5SYB5_9CAUD|nr:XerC Integrase [uncultured Caudovirales phage]
MEYIVKALISLKTSATQKAYIAALSRLAQYFNCGNFSPELFEKMREMEASTACLFYTWLRSQPAPDGGKLSDATVSQRFHILRRIFRYLVAMGCLKINVFDAVHDELPKRQRKQKRPTKLIPFEAIERILDIPDRRSKIGKRDYCLLCLLFGGGLRRSEAQSLNVGDVAVTPNGTLYLILQHTKNGAVQNQSLPSWAAEAFTDLVSQRVGEGAQSNDALLPFYSQNGIHRGRLSTESIRRIYQKYTEQVGLGKVSPHSARATAATYLKSQGIQDRDVAAFLRHTTTAMVEVYDKRVMTPETNPGVGIVYSTKKIRSSS